jgi:hypothetical protein
VVASAQNDAKGASETLAVRTKTERVASKEADPLRWISLLEIWEREAAPAILNLNLLHGLLLLLESSSSRARSKRRQTGDLPVIGEARFNSLVVP